MSDALRSEVEVLLSEDGCPACRFVAQAEDRFFRWFAIESHAAPETIERLRAALGMCPAHTRRLLGGELEPATLTSVYREVAKTAVAVVVAEDPPAACPACASAQFNVTLVLTGVLRGLDDQRLAGRYVDAGGLCLPHLLAAVPTAEPSALELVCDTLAARLEQPTDTSTLTGLDRDAPARAIWRARVPDSASAGLHRGDTIHNLLERLLVDACPACLRSGQAEREYLVWLVAERCEHGQILTNDPGEVCPAHLADLAALDAGTGAAAGGRTGDRWRSELRAVSAELALPAARPTDRGGRGGLRRADAGLPRRWPRRAAIGAAAKSPPVDRSDWGPARAGLAGDRLCPICRAVAVAQRRELALLVAALKLPAVESAYRRAHGLCARHVRDLVQPESSSLAHRHLAARLGVLSWELEESSRKEAWASRHEPKGPEATAYGRLIAQIDGHALMGAPAPVQAEPPA
jgi:hypothetical protein